MEDHSRTIVIDNGSDSIKGGFADKKTPDAVFPTLLSRRRDTSAFIASGQINSYAGEEACKRIGFHPPKRPVANGIITNPDDMELVWQYLFYSKLDCDPKGLSVLLSEPALNTKGSRERAAVRLFEQFEIGALNFSTQEALALYASGRNTGLVVDSGLDSTRMVPVYEGFALRHGVCRLDIGGQELTDYFIRTLKESGNVLETEGDRKHAGKVKEEYCYVAQDFEGEMRSVQEGLHPPIETSYTLVDGKKIRVGTGRLLAPEALFQPHLVGFSEERGIHHHAVASIAKSDSSIRDILYGNIVLAGGSSMFSGIGSRMKSEITRIAPPAATVCVHAPEERQHSTWVGGAMLSSLSTFQSMCISEQDYNEIGPRVVHRRFV